MAVQGQQNMNQFEVYFSRADLDQDGKISGNEAVAFFQGSNLSRQVLAQIWVFADQYRTGFLGRQEFYNALKLVTVAQSKRELTPEIVKAALYGPASAAIPPPRINLTQSQQPNILSSVTTTASPKVGASASHDFASQLTQVAPSVRPLSPPQVAASRTIPPNGNNTTVSYPNYASTSVAVNTVVSKAGVNFPGNKAVVHFAQDGLTTPPSGLPNAIC